MSSRSRTYCRSTGHNPARMKLIANINPHLHYPVDEELERQLALGAVACKLHPVHAGVLANDRSAVPRLRGLPVGRDPAGRALRDQQLPRIDQPVRRPGLLDDVLRDFRGLNIVLAHGGRGWWYDAAAFMALSNDRVWIELSGLPPSRLREYYASTTGTG